MNMVKNTKNDQVQGNKVRVKCATMEKKRPSIKEIQNTVAAYYQLIPEKLKTRRVEKSTKLPRMVAVYLSKLMTLESYPVISEWFGCRNYAEAIRAVKLIEEFIKDDDNLNFEVISLMEMLKKQTNSIILYWSLLWK